MNTSATVRTILSLVLSLAIAVMVLISWSNMVYARTDNGVLSASSFQSLRYFTVLSNLLMAVAAIIYLVYGLTHFGKPFPTWLVTLKWAGTVSVLMTFLTVVLFLGPMFGFQTMFKGANLYFHLIVPLLALFEFILIDPLPKPEFRLSFLAALPLVIYGLFYLGAILLYGIEGHDFYGFCTWGLPVGIVIFLGLILITWGSALLVRLLKIPGKL
ncbi:MAG: hypothetical protein IJ083_11955 [Clostridia bacterium]|nr:hypothetical protein [Clostridia bacterium]